MVDALRVLSLFTRREAWEFRSIADPSRSRAALRTRILSTLVLACQVEAISCCMRLRLRIAGLGTGRRNHGQTALHTHTEQRLDSLGEEG